MDRQFLPALISIHKLFAAASRTLHTTINFALIGGLSVAAWGVVRATEDLDFMADCDPSPIGNQEIRVRLGGYLQRQKCQIEWRVGAQDDPIPLLLRIELPPIRGGLSTDVLWAHKRWQRDALTRSIAVRLSRRRVRVLHPEDLILLKLDAGGPQDLIDVTGLLTDPPAQLDMTKLQKAARRLRLGRLLERCLSDVSDKK
jgi:hypothetical protein